MKLQINNKKQWFCWNWSESMDKKVAFTRAIITFALLLVGYACFQFSWQVVNQANNYGGPVYELYPSSSADPSISRISNWTIAIARGLVSVGIGLLIVKWGHKNAVIFGFTMFLLSFPFILTPFMKNSMIYNGMDEKSASEFSYALFIIFRMFLAVGGTTLTICQAPVIAKFLFVPKQRNAAIKTSQIPAQAAGIIASLIFINEIVGSAITTAGHWKLISGIMLIIVFVLLVIYLFVGMQFKTVTQTNKQLNFKDADQKNNSLMWLIKQPRVIIFLFAIMFSAYAGIEPGSGVLLNFWKTTANNISYGWYESGLAIPSTEISGVAGNVQNVMLIWQMLYCASLFVGLATVSRWTNTKYSISRYAGIVTIIGLVLWALSFGIGAVDIGSTAVVVFVILFGFLGSIIIFGSQAITTAVPYRWGFTPKQITTYTGLSWTWMYIGYSILDIITSYVGTAGVDANLATLSDYVSTHVDVYSTLFNNLTTDQMSTVYGDIKNMMLGSTDYQTFVNSVLAKYNLPNDAINWTTLDNIMSSQSLDESFTKIQYQYVPQICVISIIPVIGGIALLFLKRSNVEIPFTFKSFKENHMDFHNLKRLSNKLFKTNFKIKETKEIV